MTISRLTSDPPNGPADDDADADEAEDAAPAPPAAAEDGLKKETRDELSVMPSISSCTTTPHPQAQARTTKGGVM